VLFSGGHDSEVLLRASAAFLGTGMTLSLTAVSPLLAGYYLDRTAAVCRRLGVEQVLVPFDPMSMPAFRANGPDRCYLCKKRMFSTLGHEARLRGFEELVDGTSIDDLLEDRPGLAAASEEGIEHPFVEAGMGAGEIDRLGLALGAEEGENPSDSCLATRLPAGTGITLELLELVDRIESPLRPHARGRIRARPVDGEIVLEFTSIDQLTVHRSRSELERVSERAGSRLRLRRKDP